MDYELSVSLPDYEEAIDAVNRHIYLDLSEENAQHLNSYDSDFEENQDEEFDYLNSVEAINTVISLYCSLKDFNFSANGEFIQETAENISIYEKIEEKLPQKVTYIIQELISTEYDYVQNLESGIKTYISTLHDNDVPFYIRKKKYHIFGNIEFIHQFHRDQFLPALTECMEDVQKIGNLFLDFLENDNFYGYILLAIYRIKAKKYCQEFQDFFKKKQLNSCDKLGIDSFLLQPIQRLPRYQLMMRDIQKALLSFSEKIAEDELLHLYCKVEKRLRKFINLMNESITVNEIAECDFNQTEEIDLGLGISMPISNLIYHNNEGQSLYLVPKGNSNASRNKPINLLQQGKFRCASSCFIQEHTANHHYHGKIFIFERCVIYTEVIQDKKLEYRGHFFHYELTMNFENKQILKLFINSSENQEIFVKNDIQNPGESLQTLAELIEVVIRSSFRKKSISIRSSLRSSLKSFVSLNSTFTNSINSNYVSEMDSFLTFNQNYLKFLRQNITFYLENLPEDPKETLEKYIGAMIDIKFVQRRINFRLFGKHLTNTCDIFYDFLSNKEFDVYFDMITEIQVAESTLIIFEQYMNTSERGVMILPIENFLNLPMEFVNQCKSFFENYNTCSLASLTKLQFVRNEFDRISQRLHENLQIRKLISDSEFLNEIGIVLYSEKVNFPDSYSKYRIFIMETGLLCLRTRGSGYSHENIEEYSFLVFFIIFSQFKVKIGKRNNSLKILNEKRKIRLLFESEKNRNLFYEILREYSAKMKFSIINKKKTAVFYYN